MPNRADPKSPTFQGSQNAQDEDQERRQEALLAHRHRQGADEPLAQAPRPGQPAAADEAPASRFGALVRARRQDRQEILSSERLRRADPWLASSGASPPTPATRRSSTGRPAIAAPPRPISVSPSRRARRGCAMPIATPAARSPISPARGSSASMPPGASRAGAT